jgi:UDP:flavonoid glycosyltransferase YjiC (YdhE family)
MKLGFVSMPISGHLNPMTALARKLQSRGNEAGLLAFRMSNLSLMQPVWISCPSANKSIQQVP